MLYNLHFFSSKCRLFHNATLFGFCITHILNTECAKTWKKIRRQKVKNKKLQPGEIGSNKAVCLEFHIRRNCELPSNSCLCSELLRAGQSGDRIPLRARFSPSAETSTGTNPDCCTMNFGSLSRAQRSRGVALSTHLHLVPMLKKEYNLPSRPLLNVLWWNFYTVPVNTAVLITRKLSFSTNTSIYYVLAKVNMTTCFDHKVIFFRPLKYIKLKLQLQGHFVW